MRSACLTLLLALATADARADEGEISGAAKVRGPDMLVLAGTRIRLSGVLPPEETSRCAGAAASCAELAAATLGALADRGAVTCVKERRLGHGYYLGHCRTADDRDPAFVLLGLGLLQVDPAGASESYVQAADAARLAGAGLWGS